MRLSHKGPYYSLHSVRLSWLATLERLVVGLTSLKCRNRRHIVLCLEADVCVGRMDGDDKRWTSGSLGVGRWGDMNLGLLGEPVFYCSTVRKALSQHQQLCWAKDEDNLGKVLCHWTEPFPGTPPSPWTATFERRLVAFILVLLCFDFFYSCCQSSAVALWLTLVPPII